MKRVFHSLTALLATAALFSACSGNEDFLNEQLPQQTWTAVVRDAVKGNLADETRALFIGGHTNRYGSLWDDGDVVQVYKEDVKVDGQLTPDEASWGTKSATLTGTLTGSFAVNEELTLYQPSFTMNFTGQTGSLQSASAKTYQTGTVTVETAQENTLTLSNVQLDYLMYYVRFLLLDDDTKERLHPSRLELHALSGGEIVLTKDEEGNIGTGDLVINTVKADGEYPGEVYVALMNKDYARVSYELVATVGDDIYVGPITSKSGDGYGAYSPNFGTRGQLRECFRYMKKVTANTLTLSATEAEVTAGGTTTVTVDANTGGGEVTATSSDPSVATVSIEGNTITITGVEGAEGTATITVRSAANDDYAPATQTITVTVNAAAAEDDLFVDLGLSVKWAKMNVGATSETDYGDYYAWGETSPHADNSYDLSDYTFSSNPETLGLENDAAYQWNNKCRMPTKAEFDELLSGTRHSWATISGVNGHKFVSKIDASKYIFLPAAGIRSGTSLSYEGSDGFYWVSSLYTSNTSSAWSFNFNSGYAYMDYYERNYGQSVRGVQRNN